MFKFIQRKIAERKEVKQLRIKQNEIDSAFSKVVEEYDKRYTFLNQQAVASGHNTITQLRYITQQIELSTKTAELQKSLMKDKEAVRLRLLELTGYPRV